MILAKNGFEEGFDKSLEQAALLVPKIGYFLLILIVGIFVAKLVQRILTKVLQKAGFDRVVERGGIKQALANSKYDAASILAKIVYYFIFLAVLSMAFAVFGQDNPISEFLAAIIAFLPKLFVAVLALVLAFAIAAAVKDLLSNMLGGLSYGAMLANAASIAIIVLGVFFALGQLQVAEQIVGPLFIAILALLIVPPIISFGVGGIDPARETIRSLQARGKATAKEIRAEVQSEGEQPPRKPAKTATATRRRTTR